MLKLRDENDLHKCGLASTPTIRARSCRSVRWPIGNRAQSAPKTRDKMANSPPVQGRLPRPKGRRGMRLLISTGGCSISQPSRNAH